MLTLHFNLSTVLSAMLPMTDGNYNNKNVHVAGDEQAEEADFASIGYNLENTHVSLPITDDLTKSTPIIIKDSLIHKLRYVHCCKRSIVLSKNCGSFCRFFKMTKDTEAKDQPSTDLKKFGGSKSKLFKIVRSIVFVP